MSMEPNGHASADTIQRYVAGVAGGEELRTLELHLLACAACEAAVRQGAAIRAGLLAIDDDTAAPASPRGWRRRATIPLATLLAAASLIVIVAKRDDGMQRLGRADAVAPFVPLSVRAPATETDRLVDSAMTLYRARQLAEATVLLARAAARDSSAGVVFYLGAAALASGSPREALDPLRRSAGETGSPYAADAGVLLAKAWLQLGNADSAVAVLTRSMDDPDARALLDSVRALRSRR